MAHTLGKALQVAGLVILPLAMFMQVTGGLRAPVGQISVSTMLLLLVFGVAIFGLGRVVEGYAGR